MEKVALVAKIRDVFGKKVKQGRKDGLVPAVVYGKDIETSGIWVKELDLTRLLRQSGESTMIELDVDGKKQNVIIYEIQRDPVKGGYMHVDFFKVRMDEEIETEVELVFIGESPAVKEQGGILVKNMDKVTVKCLPAYLPSEIEVDISVLGTFDDHIIVSDLKVAEQVKIDVDPETVVALVTPPRSAEELEQLEEKVEEDVTKVEGVVKEGAPEEGAESQEKKD